MAFDGIYISSIEKELKNKLKDSRIEKIHQPESDEIIITFKNKSGSYKVLMTSSSDSARCHITERIKQNPMQAPLFTMVLRKHLQSGKLLEVEQVSGDRILNFIISSTDEMGFDSRYILSVEMMGKHSNIILIRERDNKIMESIKHVGYDQNSYRSILPGNVYKAPPLQEKLNPQNFKISDINEFIKDNNIEITDTIFTELFVGISKKTSKLLFNKILTDETNENFSNNLDILINKISEVVRKAIESEKYFILYKNQNPVDISLIEPDLKEKEKYDEVLGFDSPSQALEEFISKKDSLNRVKERAFDIIRILNNNIERVKKKIQILEKTIEESEEKDLVRLKGELIQSNLYMLKDGMSEVYLENYYDDNKPVKVVLDPHKTVSLNMQNYFKRYNKLKKSAEMASEQLSIAKEELDYLNTVSDSVLRSETPDDIEEIKQELIVAGYIRYKTSRKKKDSPSKPMRFKSSEGVTIYVGKNNLQNDFLTTKLAENNDTWLHTKGYPGSHVIIRSSNFNEETLLEAANLAAYYSKGSNGSKIPVDYTLVKNVKKPNGSKPGMVIYSTNKTIYITPEIPRIERF